MKTLIAVNNLTSVSQLSYANHSQFWYRIGKEYPNDTFGLCNPRRMSIDRMRNFAGRSAVDLGFDYLMFIDDDVLLPMDAFSRLQKANKDIIAGVTLIRGYPYHPMIFNFMGPLLGAENKCHFVDDYKDKADPNGLLECDAVGFSCCLIKVDILKKLKPPYFITGENHTEDVYFCARAKNEIRGCSVWVDTQVKTAHILGDDIIEPDNLEARMLFDEQANPGLAAKTKDNESRQPIIDPKVARRVDHANLIKKVIWG